MLPGVREYFEGRWLVIATMHKKERVIAPLIKDALGVEVVVPGKLDTDQFGTFSGEIERCVDPLEAARLKCKMACEQHNCSLAIASEGSFGPHPGLFFVPADDEILLLLDLKNGFEIKARELSTKTNFNGSLVYSWDEAKIFAKKVLFPGHGLIVRRDKEDVEELFKGIRSWKDLKALVHTCLDKYGHVFLETDMRAMHNPTRMRVIEAATRKLINTIARQCPDCKAPGLDVGSVLPGLPCSQCGAPTRSTLALIYRCDHCTYTEEKKFPHGKTSEDPMYCDWCNP